MESNADQLAKIHSTAAYSKLVSHLAAESISDAAEFYGRPKFYLTVISLAFGVPGVVALASAISVYYGSWLVAVCSALIYIGWCSTIMMGCVGMAIAMYCRLTRVADLICISAMPDGGKKD